MVNKARIEAVEQFIQMLDLEETEPDRLDQVREAVNHSWTEAEPLLRDILDMDEEDVYRAYHRTIGLHLNQYEMSEDTLLFDPYQDYKGATYLAETQYYVGNLYIDHGGILFDTKDQIKQCYAICHKNLTIAILNGIFTYQFDQFVDESDNLIQQRTERGADNLELYHQSQVIDDFNTVQRIISPFKQPLALTQQDNECPWYLLGTYINNGTNPMLDFLL